MYYKYYVGTKHCGWERKRKKFIEESRVNGFDAKFIRTMTVECTWRIRGSEKFKLKFNSKIDIWEMEPNENAKLHSLIIWSNFPKIMFIEEGVLHY